MHASAQPQGAPAFTRDAYDRVGVAAPTMSSAVTRP